MSVSGIFWPHFTTVEGSGDFFFFFFLQSVFYSQQLLQFLKKKNIFQSFYAYLWDYTDTSSTISYKSSVEHLTSVVPVRE